VREIATRHRARVTLRDNPAGSGTLFGVAFPARAPAAGTPG